MAPMLPFRFAAFLAAMLLAPLAFADRPIPPRAYHVVTSDKQHVFAMRNPPEWFGAPMPCPAHEPACRYPKSGLYRNDGSMTPRWTVDWYAHDVLVAADARHLITFNRGVFDYGSPALTFFAQAKEIRTYALKELVSRREGVFRTSSTLWWFKDAKLDDAARTLTVTASTGDVRVFDITTGALVRSVLSRHCEPEGKLAGEGYPLGFCSMEFPAAAIRDGVTLAAGSEGITDSDKSVRSLAVARLAEGSTYHGIKLPPGTIYLPISTLRLASELTIGTATLSGDIDVEVREERSQRSLLVQPSTRQAETHYAAPRKPGKLRVHGAEARRIIFRLPAMTVAAAELVEPVHVGGFDAVGEVTFFGDGKLRSFKAAKDARVNGVSVKACTTVNVDRDGYAEGYRGNDCPRLPEGVETLTQEFDRSLLAGAWDVAKDTERVCAYGRPRRTFELSADGTNFTVTVMNGPEDPEWPTNSGTWSGGWKATVVKATRRSLLVRTEGEHVQVGALTFVAPGVARMLFGNAATDRLEEADVAVRCAP